MGLRSKQLVRILYNSRSKELGYNKKKKIELKVQQFHLTFPSLGAYHQIQSGKPNIYPFSEQG